MPFTYSYPRPALTADCVVFGWDGDKLHLLLIERQQDPFAESWALPGGFLGENEAIEIAARRELKEETGLEGMFLEQVGAFGEPGRDPRGHVVTVAWVALVNHEQYSELHAATDARDARWWPFAQLPELAFDHPQIIDVAYQQLQEKIRNRPIGLKLLPEKFSLAQLQRIYEAVLNRTYDRRNFRKKVLSTGLLIQLDETEVDKPHRAANLYRFDHQRYENLMQEGFEFRI